MSFIRNQPAVESCSFGPWTVKSTKSHILCSEGPEKEQFESEAGLPSYPEMVFNKNTLCIEHEGGFGIHFNALDALKLVDKEHDTLKVAGSVEWKQARSGCEHITNVIKPFDWTFTTDYRGTLFGEEKMKISDTSERIDIEKLKGHDKIQFYADVMLFEDELHDHGTSILNAKIRVMPEFFFLLQRLYMRVDDVLIRINDTRLYHEAGSDFILREFTSRENKIEELKVPPHVYSDPNEAWQHLSIKTERMEKIHFESVTKEDSSTRR